MSPTKSYRTPIYLRAEAMLPPELHNEFARMVAEYKFASLKHHQKEFASPRVIAELILIGMAKPSQSTKH